MTHSHTTQYHTVKRIDNSRLARPTPKARLNDCWRTVAIGAAMAACLLSYAWQHFECIQLHYQLEQLQTARAQALELNRRADAAEAGTDDHDVEVLRTHYKTVPYFRVS